MMLIVFNENVLENQLNVLKKRLEFFNLYVESVKGSMILVWNVTGYYSKDLSRDIVKLPFVNKVLTI